MAFFTAASALFGVSGTAQTVLERLSGKWKDVAMGALLAVIVYQNVFEHRVFFWADTIPYLRAIVDDREDAVDLVVDANTRLTEAIQATNTEVEKARAITEQLRAEKDVLEGELRERRLATQEQVRAILNAPVPQTCQAAIGFLRDMIPSLEYDFTGVPPK